MEYVDNKSIKELKSWKEMIRDILVTFIIIILLTILYRRFLTSPLTQKYVRNNIFFKMMFIFIDTFLAISLIMYILERNKNPSFSSFAESIWSNIVYLLSGIEDREPKTTVGRILSTFMLLTSILIFGSIAGNFAAFFIERRKSKMPKDLSGHFVICNWNEGGERVIREIHSPDAAPNAHIVVIADHEPPASIALRQQENPNITFIKSDPVLHSVLKLANVEKARSVIILSDENQQDPDSQAVLVALAVKHLSDSQSRKPNVVAQARNHRKIKHLLDAGVDEVICSQDYGLGLLSQCALNPGMSQAYSQLLSFSIDTCEFYPINNPTFLKAFEGKTFEEISQWFLDNRDAQNPLILIGIFREGKLILNPRKHRVSDKEIEFKSFREGDHLLVMGYDPPNIRLLLAQLEKSQKST